MNIIVQKSTKNKIFSAVLSRFYLAVILTWPCNDFGVTTMWNTTPFQHVYLGWTLSDVINVLLAIGQKITSVCYLDHFFHIRQYWHKDEGRGMGAKNTSTLYVIPVTSQGCFCVGLCCDLGICGPPESNVAHNKVKKIWSTKYPRGEEGGGGVQVDPMSTNVGLMLQTVTQIDRRQLAHLTGTTKSPWLTHVMLSIDRFHS